MILKTIHYCWFGCGKQNDLIQKCISTWKDVLPEYKIILWNEDNFPVNKYPFAKQALHDKKWAFVSDVARLHALYYHGGIYMDTYVFEGKMNNKRFMESLFPRLSRFEK